MDTTARPSSNSSRRCGGQDPHQRPVTCSHSRCSSDGGVGGEGESRPRQRPTTAAARQERHRSVEAEQQQRQQQQQLLRQQPRQTALLTNGCGREANSSSRRNRGQGRMDGWMERMEPDRMQSANLIIGAKPSPAQSSFLLLTLLLRDFPLLGSSLSPLPSLECHVVNKWEGLDFRVCKGCTQGYYWG